MPKTKIEWTERTWKIVQGCKHGCPYCYVRRFDSQWNIPRFNEKVYTEPLKRKQPSTYFVANTGDLFGAWVPKEWIIKVLEMIQKCPQHTFQLLTKNPARYAEFNEYYRNNTWVGVSVTNNVDIPKIYELLEVRNVGVKFISFEPLLETIMDPMAIPWDKIDWAIVGAESIGSADNPKNLAESQEYAAPLIRTILNAKVPLFTKPNLCWKLPYKQMPAVAGAHEQLELSGE